MTKNLEPLIREALRSIKDGEAEKLLSGLTIKATPQGAKVTFALEIPPNLQPEAA
ncbi:MAG: hypothetical protein HGA90_05795, partial [Alphaproteobacteria bacterium]|nr:hypothetical protein [Alphaproteobacteria bacterium]